VLTASWLDDIDPYFDGIYKTKKLAKNAKKLIYIKKGKKSVDVSIKKIKVLTELQGLK
jgi:hypothetical protein